MLNFLMFQSDIASEKPGVLDCLKEGVCRLFKWGTPHSTRLLPIWQLIIPTALYGVSVYIISSLVQSVVRWFISIKQQRQLQVLIYIKFLKLLFYGGKCMFTVNSSYQCIFKFKKKRFCQ